jgi:hypothetical protein
MEGNARLQPPPRREAPREPQEACEAKAWLQLTMITATTP